MLDEIFSKLEKEAAPALMSKLGLNQQQASGSVSAAKDSVKEVLSGGDGFGLDDITNLFSSATNTAGAEGIVSKLGQSLHGKLTNQVGLAADKAGGVKEMLIPMITNYISQHIGGDGSKLQGLLSGLGGGSGLANAAKGMLGKLFS